MVSCAPTKTEVYQEDVPTPVRSWVGEMQKELAQLGKKNWIVIAEPSYTAPKYDGVKIILSNEDMPSVTRELLEGIESEGHVWARYYRAKEFNYVSDRHAPGVEQLKKDLRAALFERKLEEINQVSIDILLEEVMKEYRVLIIKTTSAYPYSTLYLELDNGYWDGESEASLREKIKMNQGGEE